MSAPTDPTWCLAPLTTKPRLADDVTLPRHKAQKLHTLPNQVKARPAPVLPYNDADSVFFCRKAKRRYRESTLTTEKK